MLTTAASDPSSWLLARLRGDHSSRPGVDPGLAGGLREWLEDELAASVRTLGASAPPVRVSKEKLQSVLWCEQYLVARESRPRSTSFELVLGRMSDALFRQWVTSGDIGDPFEDALSALAVGGDEDAAEFVSRLPESSLARLTEEVELQTERITTTWPSLSPGWFARTQERIEVPLAGGAVVIGGVVDLVLGGPSRGRASVCLVEAKSGARRLEHRADLHYYALLETLRSGAPPFRVATFYSSSGEIDAEQVGEEILVGALHRLVDGARRLCRIAVEQPPRRTPNPMCPWCPELQSCDAGMERVGARQTDEPGPREGEPEGGDLATLGTDCS